MFFEATFLSGSQVGIGWWRYLIDTDNDDDIAYKNAQSIQPKFPEILVQNSMDRFGPTGKVSKKRVHLLRWTTFPGRTGWNVGWMDRAQCFPKWDFM